MTQFTVIIQKSDGTQDVTTLDETQICEAKKLGIDIAFSVVKLKIINPDGSSLETSFLDDFGFQFALDSIPPGGDFEIIDFSTREIPLLFCSTLEPPPPIPVPDPPVIPPPPPPPTEPPPIPPPPPEEFNGQEFTQSFTVVKYFTSSRGLELFVQMQVNRNRVLSLTNMTSTLQIKNQAGQVILIETQDLNIAGVNKFGIVYEIPDLRQATRDQGNGESAATATITVQHFLTVPNNGPVLSNALSQTITVDAPPPTLPPPPPSTGDGDPLFSKIVGIFATVTAAALMASKVKT